MGQSVLHQRSSTDAEVFQSQFQALFDREANYDESALEELPQYPIHQHCDYRPTDKEIRAATRKLKNNALGESGIMPQVLKCLLYHQEQFCNFGILKLYQKSGTLVT